MIARLSGRIDSLQESSAIIDVGGVGYLVTCSSRTLARLVVGEGAVLLIDTHLREDGIYLYGFLEAREQLWFRLMIGVQGVGPRLALALLGTLPPETLVRAVASGDRAALSRAPGVGARLAARLVVELQDKIAKLPPALTEIGGAVSAIATDDRPVSQDAVSALVNLGFRPAEARSVVDAVAGRLGPDAALEELVRDSLAELAKQEGGKRSAMPREDRP